MYDQRYPPTLELQRTVFDPADPISVIGFMGRDSTYGRGAIVIKGEKIPQELQDSATGKDNAWAIPEKALAMMKQNSALYILGDGLVYATGPDTQLAAMQKTFETEDGQETFPAIKLDDFTIYAEEKVEISLPETEA